MNRTGSIILAGLAVAWLAVPEARAADARAARILAATGVKGGLVVHLGCGDGKLTAALRANDSYIVHGLDRDPAKVAATRKRILSLGLGGKVSAAHLGGKALPYIDNLVNLVVAEDLGDVPMGEVMRVLCPRGVAYVRDGAKWTRTVKPRPKDIDEWTHYLHDASNNAVANDTVVGPPRHLQWVGSPRYSRHHDHMSGASAMVTSGGRLFYIFDHASPMTIQLPSKWRLTARDAFNGTILWSRPIAEWHTRMFRLKSGPAQLPRRLVAVGDRVYATLGLYAPVSALDAVTGKTVRTFDGTARTEEIIHSDGTLFLLINDKPFRQPALPRELKYTFTEGPRRIVAVNADTGRILWNKPQPNVLPMTLTADAKHVLFCDGEKVVCLDRRDGREVWRSEALQRRKVIPSFFGPTLVAYEDMVLFSGGSVEPGEKNRGGGINTMYGLSAGDGKTIWQAEHPPSGYKSAEDLFVLGGVVWTPETTHSSHSGLMVGRNVRTGKVVKKFLPDVETHWFHHRCHRAKATVKYILTSRTGIEFVDPKTEHWQCHHWVRGACLYGIMPANGMIYNPPHPCACYLESKLYGFTALAAESPTRKVPAKVSPRGRLERGPAYNGIVNRKSSIVNRDDWPTYRNNAARSGYTAAAVPAELEKAWTTDLGGRLSSVVVAGGKLFVASIDTHTVHALDAGTGRKVWSYTAGGRVDSPPTIWRGRALFGSADGWVYCLRAADGALAWRFRAAPIDRRMTSFEQVESVWPVHGSVLIQGGELWCVAGRSMFVDGGMRLVRLAPATGRLIAERVMDDRHPETGKNLQETMRGLNMPVAMPDILSCDGKYVYMRSQRFTLDGRREELEIPTLQVTAQQGEGRHLFCPTGFLDDIWWHRSYWVFGRVWKSGAGGYSQAGRVAAAGRPMVFNDTKIYGYGRKPRYYRWTTPMEYQLFATDKETRLVDTTPRKAPQRQPGRRRRAAQPKKKKRGGLGQSPRTRFATDWTQDSPILVRAMVLADRTLFIIGPPDVVDEVQSLRDFDQAATQKQLARQAAVLRGAEGSLLRAISTADGKTLFETKLPGAPVFDGLAAAGGKLYWTTEDGKVMCMSGSK